MEISFLSLAEVLDIHGEQLAAFGGSAGVRDINLLNSALAMPMAMFGGIFLHPTIYDMGAAYLFHIVQNHPFVDGNKRTASTACLVFLELNGYEYLARRGVLSNFVLSMARGEKDKSDAAQFLKKYTRPSKGN